MTIFITITCSLEILLQVLFVCTANVVEMIPNPLLDRMEVIAIAGYITDEKMHIARDYLEKSTREACGIKPEQVAFFPFLSILWSFSWKKKRIYLGGV